MNTPKTSKPSTPAAHNQLCQLLGIEYPILQGAMAHITDGIFAATVSNAGALGVIASAFQTAEWVREQIRICKALTTKPFGVNLFMKHPDVEKLAIICIEEGVPVCSISAGNPERVLPKLSNAGVTVVCVVPNAAAAQKAEALGAAVAVCEGRESGGFVGKTDTAKLVEDVLGTVSIPVVAAGGFVDGADLKRALDMGCAGVQMGTVFLASKECEVAVGYKQLILDARDDATTIVSVRGKAEIRCLETPFAERIMKRSEAKAPVKELVQDLTCALEYAPAGDLENGLFAAGEAAARIQAIKSVKDIIEDAVKFAI